MLAVDLDKAELKLKYLNYLKASSGFESRSKKNGASDSSSHSAKRIANSGRAGEFFDCGLLKTDRKQ